jgi:hypothetical protein
MPRGTCLHFTKMHQTHQIHQNRGPPLPPPPPLTE